MFVSCGTKHRLRYLDILRELFQNGISILLIEQQHHNVQLRLTHVGGVGHFDEKIFQAVFERERVFLGDGEDRGQYHVLDLMVRAQEANERLAHLALHVFVRVTTVEVESTDS